MPAAVGTATPSAFKVGSSDCTAIYLGSTLVWTGTVAPTTRTLYNDDFTGTTGAAPKTVWKRATTYPTGGTVTIQSNAMRLSTGNTTAWTGAASIFLGDPSKPQGDTTTGAPEIVSNAEYAFDYTLANLTEQYQNIGIRVRNAELWNGGAGAGQFQTGYNLGIWPASNQIAVSTGYNAGAAESTVATISYTFPSAALKFRIKLDRKMLYLRVWAAASAEPSTWTYSGPVLGDESDGSLGFSVGNGPAAATKTVTVDNLVSTTPVLSLGASQAAPTTDPSGFTRFYTENFDTAAPAGTGTSSFLNVYANSIQPYDEVSPNYQQRAMMSAHDGVLDAAMDGTRGHAAVFGSPTNSNDRIGGRFAMRAKAIGAFNNGPAVMIWPSSTAEGPWSDGEIDFPESVSGPGGLQGFQDAPWIHHHRMNADMNLAQDVPLNVSWRDWHVYSCEWYPPGKGPTPTTGSVRYFVDEVLVYTTTQDVPTTVHRYMYQVGAYGQPGNLYIDWVTMSTVN
jgi:hypothetical protein